MGCDIHCYVEYRLNGEDSWRGFGGRINPGRNYVMFGFLAGVRDDGPPVVGLRGFPDNASWQAKDDNYLWISDVEADGHVTREKAKQYIEEHGCKFIKDCNGKECWVTQPDWHSHSWLTPSEWDAAIKLAQKSVFGHYGMPEYEAISAAMHALEKHGEVRVVFWFDN
jgi:hypothetical protein